MTSEAATFAAPSATSSRFGLKPGSIQAFGQLKDGGACSPHWVSIPTRAVFRGDDRVLATEVRVSHAAWERRTHEEAEDGDDSCSPDTLLEVALCVREREGEPRFAGRDLAEDVQASLVPVEYRRQDFSRDESVPR